MSNLETASSGVEELIGRLRDEGVQAGQETADGIVRDAQEKAAQIVAKATAEADEALTKAGAEIEVNRAAAQEDLKLALRDTQLSLDSEVRVKFSEHVGRLVSMEMADREFLQKLILAIAGAAAAELPEKQRVELMLPKELFVTERKGTKLTKKGKKKLSHLVLAISGEMLRDGFELNPTGGIHAGFRIRLVGEDLEIDLSDRALSDLILKHLTPRLKAILQGEE